MRTLPLVAERDRFAAAEYQAEKLKAWMNQRAQQLETAQLPYFQHRWTARAAIISRRRL